MSDQPVGEWLTTRELADRLGIDRRPMLARIRRAERRLRRRLIVKTVVRGRVRYAVRSVDVADILGTDRPPIPELAELREQVAKIQGDLARLGRVVVQRIPSRSAALPSVADHPGIMLRPAKGAGE